MEISCGMDKLLQIKLVEPGQKNTRAVLVTQANGMLLLPRFLVVISTVFASCAGGIDCMSCAL
jgi:hypothetical protein